MLMKKSLSFALLGQIIITPLVFIFFVPVAHAAKLSDGTAQWADAVGMSVTFTPATALAAGDVITLTFPAEAPVSDDFLFYAPGDEPVTVSGQSLINFTRNATDNSVEITVYSAATAGTSMTIALDTRVITGYNATTYAQQSIAINTQRAAGTPLDYGMALLTNDNTTEVTATVPLFVTLAADDITMDLGTLSVASVKDATQRYTVNTNNRTGMQVSVVADGPLQDGQGNTIDAVADGAVSVGSEEYGVALRNVATDLRAIAPFDTGDHALPETVTAVVASDQPVGNATFDMQYKAAISGATVAGSYQQTVTVTVATNS